MGQQRAYLSVCPHVARFTDKQGREWEIIRIDAQNVNIVPRAAIEGVIKTDAAQLKEIAEFAEKGE